MQVRRLTYSIHKPDLVGPTIAVKQPLDSSFANVLAAHS